jgi:hypothetical protein
VREVLREWDPIGVRDAPEADDEYDSYVGKAYVMLMDEGATANTILDYLFRVPTLDLGLSTYPLESCRRRRRAHNTSTYL